MCLLYHSQMGFGDLPSEVCNFKKKIYTADWYFWSLYKANKTLCNHILTLPSAYIPIKFSSLKRCPDILFIWNGAGFIFWASVIPELGETALRDEKVSGCCSISNLLSLLFISCLFLFLHHELKSKFQLPKERYPEENFYQDPITPAPTQSFQESWVPCGCWPRPADTVVFFCLWSLHKGVCIWWGNSKWNVGVGKWVYVMRNSYEILSWFWL